MEKLNNCMKESEQAMEPVEINCLPMDQYADETRNWQGIPGIERTKAGRLWATFYSGGVDEGPDNYVLLIRSEDDGNTWTKPVLVIDPPGKVRAFDPCLWVDPLGRLWLFWAQSYTFYDGRVGVWAINCCDPDNQEPVWSKPTRIANGVMMNKPTVLSTGEWLLPCAVWECHDSELNHINEERFSNLYISKDNGSSFMLYVGPYIPNRSYDEHMVVERKDGSLWMLVRTKDGIGESLSYDRGMSWENVVNTKLEGPGSRFFIRKLSSGNLLLVNHHDFKGRNNLTAAISEDDGISWRGFLMLDERDNVSYPDGIQAEDGRIYVIYDRERYKDREVLMAVFTEEDVLSGKDISGHVRMKVLVNKVG